MPWKETSSMRERVEFITDWEDGIYSISSLCEKYGISRKTGYKFLDRYARDGFEGLLDRSRAPKSSPQRLGEDLTKLFVEVRRKHPRWGPQKILHY
jgi:transposase